METNFFTGPLISPARLSEILDRTDLVILDATLPKAGTGSAPEALVKGIPGARFFDIKQTFSDRENPLPNTMPAVQQFENEASKLGITNESLIVVYDRHGIYSAPRAWWMFRAMGHENVAVLDGGLPAWEASGEKTEPLQSAEKPGSFRANFRTESVLGADFTKAAIGREDTLILDARSADRFFGRIPEPRENSRSGHIPGSKNLPFSRIAPEGKMLSAEDLSLIFKDLGAGNKNLLCSCGSGVTACILLLGAEIGGHSVEKMAVYDGSWSEWGTSPDLPIEC